MGWMYKKHLTDEEIQALYEKAATRAFDAWLDLREAREKVATQIDFGSGRPARELRRAKRLMEKAEEAFKRSAKRRKSDPDGPEQSPGVWFQLTDKVRLHVWSGARFGQGILDSLDRSLRLPDSEVVGLQNVRLSGFAKTNFYVFRHETGETEIVISKEVYDEGLLGVLLHEQGHDLFRRMGEWPDKNTPGQTLAKTWTDFWRLNQYKWPWGTMPTKYAGKNENEGFAESYSWYRCGQHLPVTTLEMVRAILNQLPNYDFHVIEEYHKVRQIAVAS